jgi:hypothetical protein
VKCEACGSELSKGFPAIRQEGSTFNVDFVPGTLEAGKFGAKGMKGRGFRKILASACDSCGRVVFHLSPRE